MTYTKQTWTDEELADVALYDIKESDDTPINEGVKIELATDVITAGSGVTAARMGHMEDGIYDAHTDIAALTTKVNDVNDLKTTGGSSTAYTITTTGAAALVTGEAFLVKFHITAGATPTLNRDSKGAKSLKYYDSTGTKQACTSANIITNLISNVLYDGTDYVVLDPAGVTGSGSGGGDTIRTKYIITPSVASNNLTVALKYIDGSDPSSTNKLTFRVGDTEYDLTSAMSFTKNAGTNWCNAGGTELAAKNVQYFMYAIGETGASAGLKFGFSRIPYAKTMGDFVNTTTNEKYIAGNWTNFNSTDAVVNIGRFQAQLSAAGAYNWSIPTANIVNYPIYETDPLTWAPQWSANSSMTFTSVTTDVAEYKIVGREIRFEIEGGGTIGGTVNTSVIATLPFAARNASYFPAFAGWVNTIGSSAVGGYCMYSSGSVYFRRYDFGNWSAGAGRYANGNGVYMI